MSEGGGDEGGEVDIRRCGPPVNAYVDTMFVILSLT